MRPSILVHLEKLPLTINGKLDASALPTTVFESDKKYRAPTNQQEKLICLAFSDALNISIVGIDDDFFKLGGNSLSAIKLTSILQTHFNVKVADIFNFRTPRNIAGNVSFGINFLEKTLYQLKQFYKDKSKQDNSKPVSIKEKLSDYLNSANNLKLQIFY